MLSYPFETAPESGQCLEVAPGVLWLRMPLPMRLDHINLYLLEEDDGWWLVDTGIAIGPTQELWEALFERELKGKPVKAVLCTHMHPDHTGMAGWLCEKWQVPCYMTQAEYFSGIAFSRTGAEHFSWMTRQHLRQCGFDAEAIERMGQQFGGFGSVVTPMPTGFRRLCDGDNLTIGGTHWRVVVGRGHSPEHACLFSDALNVLLSGDQVIPRITSNVSVSASEPEANPLREWLASHETFLEALPADCLVLPAHNTPFYGLHSRLRSLIAHHEENLLALEAACVGQSRSALELLPVLFKRELDDSVVGLAMGECVAHLNYLQQRGQLVREEDENGCYRYLSCDESLPQRLQPQLHSARTDPPLQV